MFQGHVAVVNSLIVKGENVDATTNVRIFYSLILSFETAKIKFVYGKWF